MMPYEVHKDLFVFGIALGIWVFFHHIASWGFGIYYGVRESLRRKDININYILQMTLLAFVGSLLGARILAFFGPLASCATGTLYERFLLMFSFQERGWVAYGGMIGAFFFAYLGAKLNKVSFLKYVDLTIPSVAIGISIARIGCFIAGCCYGSSANVPWAIIREGTAIHPTQLYNSLMMLAIFLIVLYLNEKRERENKHHGYMFFSFLVMYAVGRFITEFFRGDYPLSNYLYGLTTSQIISIIFILVFAPILIVKLAKERPRKTGSKFHIRPKTYITILSGGILLNFGAYILTPLPYPAMILIAAGLITLIFGINSIFKKQKINK